MMSEETDPTYFIKSDEKNLVSLMMSEITHSISMMVSEEKTPPPGWAVHWTEKKSDLLNPLKNFDSKYLKK